MSQPEGSSPVRHARLYASFMLAPLAFGALIALGLLLFVTAHEGWWWAFWTFIAGELYVILAALLSWRNGQQRHRRAG